MPPPFPGMDPYLEDPHRWPGVHNKLIGEIEAALNRLLLPRYYADIEERVYISDEADPGRKTIIPDIRVLPTGSKKKPPGAKTPKAPPALVCEPVVVTTLIEDEIREPFLKVVERDSRQVVTVIEVLSPTNKIAGSRGRDQYIEKRTDVLRSDTSWVEIDLLREGEPVIVRELYPECEYTVHVSRKTGRPKGVVWPIRLQQRLPVIGIPLKSGDPDAELDLQPLFVAVYDRGAYAFKIDYARDPVPPLPPELAKWANKLLRQKKLR
jgi:hypothetical protein